MNEELKQLKEQESTKLSRLKELAANPDLSSDQAAEFNKLEASVTQLQKQISTLENIERMQSDARKFQDKEVDEIAQYSIREALRAAVEGNATGLVAEMNQEARKEAREAGVTLSGNGNSILIPAKVLHAPIGSRGNYRLDVTAGTEGQFGGAINREPVTFIDYLWDNTPLERMGARFLRGLQGNLPMMQKGTKPAGGWGTENATATETNVAGTLVTMSPKRYAGFMDASNQLLNQTSNDVDNMLAEDLLRSVGNAINAVGFEGGGANEPTGILGTAGIGDVVGGTNGAAPTHDHILRLEELVALENAEIGSLYYATNAKVRRVLKGTAIESGASDRVYDIRNNEAPLNGYRAEISNLVPSDLTKGSADAVCSAIIYGNFQDLIIGQWGGLEVMVNPYTRAKDGVTELIINAYIDVLVARTGSFAAMKDALTA